MTDRQSTGGAADLTRARVLLELSRPAEAVGVLARFLATEPASLEGWVLLARAELARGEPARALEAAGRGLALAPEEPVTHLAASSALTRLGRHDEAVWAARDVVRLAPGQSGSHVRLARALSERGDPRALEEAWPAALRAVELAPEDPESHAVVGEVASAQRRDEVAERAYRQVLALAPEHRAARHGLGLLALRRGDLPAAAERFLASAAGDRTGIARASLEVTLWRVLGRLHVTLLLVGVFVARLVPADPVLDDGGTVPAWLRVVVAVAVAGAGCWAWTRAQQLPARAWAFLRDAMLSALPVRVAVGALVVGVVALLLGLAAPDAALEAGGVVAMLAGAAGLLAVAAGGASLRRRFAPSGAERPRSRRARA